MVENNKIEYIIRESFEGDCNFILNSWFRSFKSGSPEMFYCCPHKLYKPWMRRYQMGVLEKGARALIAASSEDMNQILGWILYYPQKPLIVEYIYVKDVYRNLGIASGLLQKLGIRRGDAILANSLTKPCFHIKAYDIIKLIEPELYIASWQRQQIKKSK